MPSEIATSSISDQGADRSPGITSGGLAEEPVSEGVLLKRKELKEHFLGRLLEERYLIEAFLNGGGSSLVFSATDIKTLDKVAVKVLIKDLDSAGKSIKRFNQEARTTRYLRHKHIVEIYSYGVEANHAYFVMELLNGGSLEDWLASDKSLGLEASLKVYRQIALALAYAHVEGVIHRDLKPSN
ncbi:MAG TPA: protein kinase, partial [Candidatus Melainabacteria bacterium]|nr:protein kinase [Candidatus Melainabacteria bacterium]